MEKRPSREIMIYNKLEIENKNLSTVILAGGHSSRMGFPKMWLPFNRRFSFLEQIVSQYQKIGCKKIVVVINHNYCNDWLHLVEPLEAKVDFVVNHFPDKGRLYSLKLGLEQVLDSEYTFVQNVDNPFVDQSLLESLYENRSKSGYACPVFQGRGGHPILLTSSCVASLIKSPWNQILKEALAGEIRMNVEVGDERILWNINTPEDYKNRIDISFPSLQQV